MIDYAVELHDLTVAGEAFRIRTLKDRLQYSDPDGAAELLGIPPSSWPIFGVLWTAGRALAEIMGSWPIAGKRILEVGCGIALPSLVMLRRGGDVTAIDHHPLVGDFLQQNLDLNGLSSPTFRCCDWTNLDLDMGHFDLIIGSDLLYESQHPSNLSDFIERQAAAVCEVLIVDARRGQQGKFNRLMGDLGFESMAEAGVLKVHGEPSFKGRLLSYRRDN